MKKMFSKKGIFADGSFADESFADGSFACGLKAAKGLLVPGLTARMVVMVMLLTAGVMTAQAQRLSFSVNGGAGIPVGNFGKGDYYDERSGFAKTGGHFNVTGTLLLSKHFGVQALAGYTRFGFKGSQNLSDGYKEDSGTDSTTLYLKGNNHSWNFLAGPTYRLGVGKKLTVTARALAGYTRTHLAGFKIFYEDYLDNAMSQKEASAGAFAWQAGLGLQYTICKHWGVQVNADYFSSKPDLAISYDNFVVNSGRRLRSYDQTLSGVNATAGIVFTL